MKNAAANSRVAPVITLLTDFGTRDGFAGIVKGVLLRHCPGAHLVDLSHEIAPQDVLGGALVLASAVRHFPPRTVHLAVVDPGVGSRRRPLAIETPDFVLVGPDNGLLSLAARAAAKRTVVHLDRPEHSQEQSGHTFHARDVFAPIAARIASGTPVSRLGTKTDELQDLSLPVPRRVENAVEGQVLYVDRFGNLVTNLTPDDFTAFREQDLSVSIREVQIGRISTHYAEAREGHALALWNSWGRLEIAVRNESAVRHLRARVGDRVVVRAQHLP